VAGISIVDIKIIWYNTVRLRLRLRLRLRSRVKIIRYGYDLTGYLNDYLNEVLIVIVP
jgi:hypothetical protein